MTNGKCPSGCNKVRLGPTPSCMCPGDSYLSEDNKMDPYGEDFDSSTSEDVEMESYDEDFYAVKKRANFMRRQGDNKKKKLARNMNFRDIFCPDCHKNKGTMTREMVELYYYYYYFPTYLA